ncbi:MAG: glycosyltransferase [Acidobacteriota bacterium]|nr:glycosyltransferase [Acidobacteriota bacterium]
MPAKISVVVISRNEGHRLRQTIENLQATLPPDSEILVVDDASVDGSTAFLARRRARVRMIRAGGLGVAKARNFGGRQTTGDVLVFADAHLKLPADWWKPMLRMLEDPGVGAVAPGIAGTNPRHSAGFGLTFRGSSMEVKWIRRRPAGPAEVPILPGCTLAMTRPVFERALGGWDDGLLQRGNVDNEISVRLWLLGYRLVVVPDVMVRHYFRRRSPFPVGWPEYLHNRLRLAFAHFSDERLGVVVARLRRYPGFGEALRLIVESDISSRRRELFETRKRNDDWYFERFRLNW